MSVEEHYACTWRCDRCRCTRSSPAPDQPPEEWSRLRLGKPQALYESDTWWDLCPQCAHALSAWLESTAPMGAAFCLRCAAELADTFEPRETRK